MPYELKVVLAFFPTHRLPTLVQGLKIFSADAGFAALGLNPVQPEVIIKYFPFFLIVVGASVYRYWKKCL